VPKSIHAGNIDSSLLTSTSNLYEHLDQSDNKSLSESDANLTDSSMSSEEEYEYVEVTKETFSKRV